MRILAMLSAARGVFPPEAEARRIALIRSYATATTEVDVDYMPSASGLGTWMTPGSTVEPALAADAVEWAEEQMGARAVFAEEQGYDAFCPFGVHDIGVRRARELTTRIAVVGQAQ